MWQELELFQQLVASGQKPDLVVFYDGFNDLAWQMNLDLTAEPTNAYDRTRNNDQRRGQRRRRHHAELGWHVVVGLGHDVGRRGRRLLGQSVSHHVYDASTISSMAPTSRRCSSRRVSTSRCPRRRRRRSPRRRANAISIQSRAATLATVVAGSVGADASFFYQPDAFTKKLLPDEEKYRNLDTYEPARWDPATAQARELLKTTPYTDVGDALDSATTPVMWDFVHTNEEGARPRRRCALLAPACHSCGLGPTRRPPRERSSGSPRSTTTAPPRWSSTARSSPRRRRSGSRARSTTPRFPGQRGRLLPASEARPGRRRTSTTSPSTTSR